MYTNKLLYTVSFAIAVSGLPASLNSSAPASVASSPSKSSSNTSSAVAAASTSVAVSKSGPSSYTQFTGDGSTAAGWPSADKWVAFADAFTLNRGTMQSSCSTIGQTQDSASEIASIKSSIESVSSATGVDARFILTVIMQESSGCVRQKMTQNPAGPNPGLMQSAGGASCFGITPCPADKIKQMISDGAGGVGGKDGLKQALASASASAVAQKTYQAARIYNSGSLGAGTNLAAGAATPCYASDIANRLSGFVGTSPCTLGK